MLSIEPGCIACLYHMGCLLACCLIPRCAQGRTLRAPTQSCAFCLGSRCDQTDASIRSGPREIPRYIGRTKVGRVRFDPVAESQLYCMPD
ncbi:hypothetical protein F4808DRAFT_410618 [Astrocystis sublimbata]|nr:hypothetical protein F4808DRAFT_410618 [Astrocystis sublimbata]